MSLTRQSYDRDAYSDRVKQSIGEMGFTLDLNRVENNERCMTYNGPRHKNAYYAYKPTELVDIDSVLSNRTFVNTQGVAKRRDQYGVGDKLMEKNNNKYFPKECNNFLDAEDSRFTHPKDWYRGLGFDVFYPLHKDPQCGVFWNFELNTRLYSRDTIFPKLPEPIDGNKVVLKPLGPRKDCGIKLNC